MTVYGGIRAFLGTSFETSLRASLRTFTAPVSGVKQERNRSIIEELYTHICAESPHLAGGLRLSDQGDHMLKESQRVLRGGGARE